MRRWIVGSNITGSSNLDFAAVGARWDGSRWRKTPVAPPRFGGPDELLHVVAPGNRDVWALGDWGGDHPGNQLIEKWDARWKLVAGPKDPADRLHGHAITGTSSSDIWIAGSLERYPASGDAVPYPAFEHWAGGHWDVSVGGRLGLRGPLWAVAEVSDTDVWATGVGNLGDENMTGYVVHITC